MNGVRAIETRFAGCHFRSRLEARWAVFFDAVGIRWHYEPEGYELPSGRYLPDFSLPELDLHFEVKPDALQHRVNDERWWDFAHAVGTIVIAYGMPRPSDNKAWGSHSSDGWMEEISHWGDQCIDVGDGFMRESGAPCRRVGWDNGRAFTICRRCDRIGITFEGRLERLPCGGCDDLDPRRDNCDDPRLLAAYTAAHSARLEHGQSGAA